MGRSVGQRFPNDFRPALFQNLVAIDSQHPERRLFVPAQIPIGNASHDAIEQELFVAGLVDAFELRPDYRHALIQRRADFVRSITAVIVEDEDALADWEDSPNDFAD